MSSLIAFMSIGPLQLLIVTTVILLLFGHRLPGTMRSLGKGITEFKKGLHEEDVDEPEKLEDQTAQSKV